LLAIGHEPAEATLRTKAQSVLADHLHGQWAATADTLREPVGKLIQAELARAPTPALIYAHSKLQPPSLPRDLLALTSKFPGGIDEDMRSALTNCISGARVEPSAAAFDDWVELARAIPASWHTDNSPRVIDVVMQHIERLAAQKVPADALVRGARGWSDALRPRYASALAARVNVETRTISVGPSSFRSGSLDRALVPLLLAWLELDRERAVGAVAEALANVGDVEQLPLLMDMLSNPREAGISSVQQAIHALIRHDPKRGASILAQRIAALAAAEGPSEEALEVVRCSGSLPDADALAMFREWWPKCVSPAAKQALLSTLVGSISGPEATAEVIARYHDIAPEQGYTRKYAIDRFAREIAFDAVPLLGEALQDPTEQVRKAAREASQAFKAHREALEEFAAWTSASKAASDSVAELTKLLESQNRDVVLGAVNALAAVKARTALPQLVKLLERNDPELKKAVQAAIAKIGE
jgi:HEAT repeat protein